MELQQSVKYFLNALFADFNAVRILLYVPTFIYDELFLRKIIKFDFSFVHMRGCIGLMWTEIKFTLPLCKHHLIEIFL